MRKRNYIMIVVAIIFITLATGCDSIQKKEEGPLKVGLLLASSTDDMYSEGYYGYYALKSLEKKYAIEISYNDNVSNENNAAYLLNNYGKKEYDLVIAIGSMFQKPMINVGPSYEKTKFICIGGDSSEGNVTSYVMPVEEIGSILGILSAGYNVNKSNSIAYIQNEKSLSYYEGFLKGIKSINSQTPVKEFVLKSDDTYTDLVNKFQGNSIGLVSVMFYSPRLEKNLTDKSYSLLSLGGDERETNIPRVKIKYDKIFDIIYQDNLKKNINGKNINLSLNGNILEVYGIDLFNSTIRATLEAALPKGD